MAKLSARGRTEIIRFSKTTQGREDFPDIIKEKETYAIMSDRKILKKRTVTWKDQYSKNGKRDSVQNWIVYATIKKEMNLEEVIEKWKNMMIKRGYEIER